MDYQSCLDFLSQFHTKESPRENKRHLFVMEELFRLFQVDHRQFKIIQITGSCGKGSTAAFLSSILTAAHIPHGLFTGPHLIRYEERFVINGQMMTSEEFTKILTEIIKTTVTFDMRDVGHKHLMTLTAMLWFTRKKVPLVIFENGAGGASDPSNVFEPAISCLTEITLDHTHLLGETIEAITMDKAAIIKDNTQHVVCGMDNFEARGVLIEIEKRLGRKFAFIHRDYELKVANDGLTYSSGKSLISQIELGLEGEHQRQNAANALKMSEGLVQIGYHIDAQAMKDGLREARLPGRLEIRDEKGLKIILDGAHNPLELKVLHRSLGQLGFEPKVVLVSFASKKNVEEMLTALNEKKAYYVVAPSPFIARQQAQSSVEEVFNKLGLTYSYCENVEQALKVASEHAQKGMILVTGSLYLVGRVREILLNGHSPEELLMS